MDDLIQQTDEELADSDPLKFFSEYFLKEIMFYKPTHIDEKTFLEKQVFCTHLRTIEHYYVFEPFRMRGYIKLSNTEFSSTLPITKIKASSRAWVRFDDLNPNEIEVEIDVKDGKEYVFKLDPRDWYLISKHMRLVKDKDRSKKRGYTL